MERAEEGDSGGALGYSDVGGDRAARSAPPPSAPAQAQRTVNKDQAMVFVEKKTSTTPRTQDATGQTSIRDQEQHKNNEGEVVETWTTTEWEEVVHEIGPVYTTPGDIPRLRLTPVRDVEDPSLLLLPLEHTHVDAQLTGPVARVSVSQRYTNPYETPIEAVYVFPLPENSAVDGMRLVVGERVIEGVVRDRETARQIYEDARASGHVAALLEQERPNIFTQSVANLPPGEPIAVDIRYVQDLTYDAGRYEFVFPMVVGPRYIPPGVSDAHRINPPVLGEGMRSGHDISLNLSADAGVAIRSFKVPTHDVEGGLDRSGRLKLALASHDQLPNRDFVLRYHVADALPQPTLLSERHGPEEGGHSTTTAQPPKHALDAPVHTLAALLPLHVTGLMPGGALVP